MVGAFDGALGCNRHHSIIASINVLSNLCWSRYSMGLNQTSHQWGARPGPILIGSYHHRERTGMVCWRMAFYFTLTQPKNPTRPAALKLLLPSRLAIIIWLFSKSLKSSSSSSFSCLHHTSIKNLLFTYCLISHPLVPLYQCIHFTRTSFSQIEPNILNTVYSNGLHTMHLISSSVNAISHLTVWKTYEVMVRCLMTLHVFVSCCCPLG